MFEYMSEVTWCHAIPVMEWLLLSDLHGKAAPRGKVR